MYLDCAELSIRGPTFHGVEALMLGSAQCDKVLDSEEKF